MDIQQTREVRLTHIGGPTVLIEIGQLRLLTDPTFEQEGHQYGFGAQLAHKTASPTIQAAQLGRIDAVLLSHEQHGDNLDPAGRALLPQAGSVLTTIASAQRLGSNAHGLAPWETFMLSDDAGLRVRVTATPAQHGPEEILEAIGDVSGWLLEWEGQRQGALYISGDTVLYKGLAEIPEHSRIALALLHFGAARRQRFGPAHLTFTAAEGAQYARQLGTATIIPIHYEGWDHLSEGRAEIEQAFLVAGLKERLRFLPVGEAASFTP